jgi:menaquinol-cytochrome c reductase iron-sulfur subunit
MSDKHSAPPTDDTARRSFLVRFGAVVFGAIVAVFPFLAGLGVIFDPCRRRKTAASTGAAGSDADDAKYVRICALDTLTAGGAPQPFPVILNVVDDAWTRTFDQKVGMVFLERSQAEGDSAVIAFNAACPHLGCFVDFNSAKGDFECPCHKSAFAKNGDFIFGPSRRGLDRLDVKLKTHEGQTDVYVAFQNFESGIAERKPIE